MPQSTGALAVGNVTGAHGTRGAVRVHLHDRNSTSLQPGLEVELRLDGNTERLRVHRIAPKPGSALIRVWFEGIGDREQADALRGGELWVERTALPPLAPDEFYLADLVGTEVENTQGLSLGRIVGVTNNGAQDLLEVHTESGLVWFCPALSQFLIECERERVVVDLLEGMLPESLEGTADG